MEEAPTKPDAEDEKSKPRLPKRLWESVGSGKQPDSEQILSEIPLDYEADDVQPEETAETTEAVSMGDIIAERYQTMPPSPEATEIKSIDEQKDVFAQHQHQAEAQLDEIFAISEQDQEQEKSAEPVLEDLPETYFERRHEVKDEPGQAEQAGADSSVHPASGAGILDEAQHDDDASLYREETTPNRATQVLGNLTSGLYGQAIRGGIWGGLAIAIVLFVIFLVSKA